MAVSSRCLGVLLVLCAWPLGAQGTIRGVVHDSLLSDRPLAGAQVVLQGAPQTATTDRLGRFVIRDVPAGTYAIGFFHPVLDSLEVTAPLARVTVGPGGTANVSLAMPSASALGQALCGREPEASTAVVFGIARDAERGEPLAGAVVRAHWFVMQLVAGVAREAQRFESDTTAADGRYVLCGVPNDIALTMSAAVGEQVTGELHLALDHLGIGRRDLLVSRSDTASRALPLAAAGDTLPARRAPGSGRLRVLVQDERGRPVAGATVGVRGSRANGTTDAEGRVRLVGIPAGSQTLLVRRPGSEPVLQLVGVRADAETDFTATIGRSIVLLPAVAVTGKRVTQLDREIRTRLALSSGRMFDERQLRAAANGGLGFWGAILGVRVANAGFDALPYMQSSRMEPCQPNLWYNGARLNQWEAWELRTLLIGAKRMEVYPRPGNVPPQFFSNSDCGVIAVWS